MCAHTHTHTLSPVCQKSWWIWRFQGFVLRESDSQFFVFLFAQTPTQRDYKALPPETPYHRYIHTQPPPLAATWRRTSIQLVAAPSCWHTHTHTYTHEYRDPQTNVHASTQKDMVVHITQTKFLYTQTHTTLNLAIRPHYPWMTWWKANEKQIILFKQRIDSC